MTSSPRSLALVTGASAGLGLDMVRILAARGWDVILTARSHDTLEALAHEVREEHGVTGIPFAHDLSDPSAVDRLVADVASLGRPLDLLVNNAGFGQFGPWLEQDGEREADQLRLNVEALTRLTRALAPGMVQRGGGGILNVASTAAFQPGPLMAVYYATKAYVLSFSEALHHELRDTGVRVTCLCPGPTATEFQDRAGMGGSRLFRAGVMASRPVAEAGIDGVLRGRRLVVPGWRNRVGTLLVRFVPRGWVLPVVESIQRAK
jgi:hypothetical protein